MEEGKINVWENDPSTGTEFNGGTIIEVNASDISATSLRLNIDQPKPPVAQYAQGTAGFRYWNLVTALARVSSFWGSSLPNIPWQTRPVLNVVIDAAEELQSEYSRKLMAVRFYHKKILDKTIYTCESPDLVCHEMGHAVLDAIKPLLWHTSLKEVDAFHEAFGDISAILCGLQVHSLRSLVLAETGGALYNSCSVSKFAKQFGWAKRQRDPSTTETDCYRNAVNSLFYKETDLLQPAGTIHELTNAPHSLSRVFTGAVFEGLAGMCSLHPGINEAILLQVSRDMAAILVNGIREAEVTSTFFIEAATKMVHQANALFPDIAYGQALRSAFIRHGILSLSNAAEFAKSLFEKNSGSGLLMENQSAEPAKLNIPVSQFGLGVDNIVVQGAEKINSINTKKAIALATAYIESLIAKGKLKIAEPQTGGMSMKVLQPSKESNDSNYTHELKKEGNEYVLERLRI